MAKSKRVRKIFKKFVGIVLCVLFIVVCYNVSFLTIFSVADGSKISLETIEQINNNNLYGKFVDANLSEEIWTTGGKSQKRSNISFKLFGFIPIKKSEVIVCNSQDVFLGGVPLGFSILTDGVIVIGVNSIDKKINDQFKSGDIICKINNKKICSSKDIADVLEQSKEQIVDVEIMRNDKIISRKITPIYDDWTQTYKLGVWIRNHAQGVGTLTFVTEDGKYGALGHSICDYETGTKINVDSGKVYETTMLGITKGKRGKAGELRCLFVQGSENVGEVEKNTEVGVFGNLDLDNEVVDKNLTTEVVSRLAVCVGKAQIVSSVSGIRENYDIEIIKIHNNSGNSNKSFIFRVTDPRLVKLTGGIVQGMSGSPIIQNGKLIGAVTHVFLQDSTKGYGVFSDLMLEEVA